MNSAALLAVDLPFWLAKAMQVAFFIGAIGAGVVVLFVIKDYVGVIFSKDDPADGGTPLATAAAESDAAQPRPQATR